MIKKDKKAIKYCEYLCERYSIKEIVNMLNVIDIELKRNRLIEEQMIKSMYEDLENECRFGIED